jgi:ketosteroid isomerase-like protein
VSTENVAIVRAAFAAMDEHGVEAVLPFNAEDVVIHAVEEWPDDPVYHGHDGIRTLLRAWTDNFDDFRFQVHDFHQIGETVVGLFEITGRAKGAGVPISQQIGGVFSDFRDGRIGHTRYFSTWRAALESAGRTG